MTLTGAGYNAITTGIGNDVITLSGVGNWVDAGAAVTFNTIYGGAGQDTFVLAAPGSGFDKILQFHDAATATYSICKMCWRLCIGMAIQRTSVTTSSPRAAMATRLLEAISSTAPIGAYRNGNRAP